MRFLRPIFIQMLFAVRFASQREYDYSNQCSDIKKENVRKKLFIYKWQIYIIIKWTLYMLYSVASLWELVMFLFSYYKPSVVTWLLLLFHIYGIGRTTHKKFDTVNREYTVRNSKTNIHHILICSYILIVIMSTTITIKLL
jgi:ATP/ADP translocase